jgi:hypothetical protein
MNQNQKKKKFYPPQGLFGKIASVFLVLNVSIFFSLPLSVHAEESVAPSKQKAKHGGGDHPSPKPETKTHKVATWDELKEAIQAVNAGTISRIELTKDITRLGKDTAENDLPTLAKSAVIDGNNNILDFGPGIARARYGLSIGSVTEATELTVTDMKVRRSGSTHADTRYLQNHFIGHIGSVSDSVAVSGTDNWTVNVNNVEYLGGGADGAGLANSGLVQITNSTVSFSGTIAWDSEYRTSASGGNQNTGLVQAQDVYFTDGTAADLSSYGIVLRIRGSSPSLSAKTDMTLSVTGGARVNLTVKGAAGAGETIGDGQAVYIGNYDVYEGVDANASRPRVVVDGKDSANVTRETSLKVYSQADGRSAYEGCGTFHINGGGYHHNSVVVDNGASLIVESKNFQSALVCQADNSTFVIDNGATMDITSRGDGSTRNTDVGPVRYGSGNTAATLWFRLVGNQVFQISNKAVVNITNTGEGNGASPAIRYYNAGNGFTVNSGGQVFIHNYGYGEGPAMPLDEGGANQGVEFDGAVPGYFFDVTGEDSLVQILSDKGKAIEGQPGSNDSRISVTDGATFVARGATPKNNAHAIFEAGNNFNFIIDNPKYYDFANTRSGGGRIVNCGADSVFSHKASDVSFWKSRGDGERGRGNAIDGSPYKAWTLIDFTLSGSNFSTLSYSEDPDPDGPDPDDPDPDDPDPDNPVDNPIYDVPFRDTDDSFGSLGLAPYTRMTGNNASPVIKRSFEATNAESHVHWAGSVNESIDFSDRAFWPGEVFGSVTVTQGSTGETVTTGIISSENPTSDYPSRPIVDAVTGLVFYDKGALLRAGDIYEMTSLWRGKREAQKVHLASSSGLPSQATVVKDVLPPLPAKVSSPKNGQLIIGETQEVTGTYSDASTQDAAEPHNPDQGVKIVAIRTDSSSVVQERLEEGGILYPDGTWSFALENTSGFSKDDKVFFVLIDGEGNENPLEVTPKLEATMAAAPFLTVVAAEESGSKQKKTDDGKEDPPKDTTNKKKEPPKEPPTDDKGIDPKDEPVIPNDPKDTPEVPQTPAPQTPATRNVLEVKPGATDSGIKDVSFTINNEGSGTDAADDREGSSGGEPNTDAGASANTEHPEALTDGSPSEDASFKGLLNNEGLPLEKGEENTPAYWSPLTSVAAALALLLPLSASVLALHDRLKYKRRVRSSSHTYRGALASTPVLLVQVVTFAAALTLLFVTQIPLGILFLGDYLTVVFGLILLVQLLVPMIAIVFINKRRRNKEKESSFPSEKDMIL